MLLVQESSICVPIYIVWNKKQREEASQWTLLCTTRKPNKEKTNDIKKSQRSMWKPSTGISHNCRARKRKRWQSFALWKKNCAEKKHNAPKGFGGYFCCPQCANTRNHKGLVILMLSFSQRLTVFSLTLFNFPNADCVK